MEVAGRSIVMTGATGGIGAALVSQFVAAGARVMAVGRRPEALDILAKAHPTGSVVPVVADVTRAEDRARLVVRASSVSPSPSLLVIAHAQSAFGLFEDQSLRTMDRVIETNLEAPMLLIRAMLPMLGDQERSAVVVVGSTFGSIGAPGFAAYSACKFGLRGLMEALAREYADRSIAFQYLSPRATRTVFNTPAVDALNRQLGVAVDEPADVAQQLFSSIQRGERRRQIGWPEKFFARLNGVFPSLIDRGMRAHLPIVRRHAQAVSSPVVLENRHEEVLT